MTKEELNSLGEDVIKKLGAVFKAEFTLAEESKPENNPNGFIDKKDIDNLVKAQKEHAAAEAKYREGFSIYYSEQKRKRDADERRKSGGE
jgi:hypothetical protein